MSFAGTLREMYRDLGHAHEAIPVMILPKTGIPVTDYSARIEKIKEDMGASYVCHASRRVQKGNYEQKVLRVDVASTFKRIQKQLAKETTE